jgi:dihydrofolate reductase
VGERIVATDEFGSDAWSQRLNHRAKEGIAMRKVIVNEFMTLDGVIQAPGGADEDRDGGFEHGGWQTPLLDDVAQKSVVEGMAEAGGFLLGRKTYEIFAGYWPTAPEEEAAVAGPLNSLPKYVASTTLTEPLAWQNSTVLEGDVAEAVAALKGESGKDLHVIGSGELAQTLMNHDLVDEYRLMINPILVGSGKRLFRGDNDRKMLRLADSTISSTGVVIATYDTADD